MAFKHPRDLDLQDPERSPIAWNLVTGTRLPLCLLWRQFLLGARDPVRGDDHATGNTRKPLRDFQGVNRIGVRPEELECLSGSFFAKLHEFAPYVFSAYVPGNRSAPGEYHVW